MKRVSLWIMLFGALLGGCYHVPPLTERQWGYFIDQRVQASSVLLYDDLIESRLAEIGRRVVAASDCPEEEFSFRIVNDATVNAFTLPGGHVYVTTNLLAFVENEGELAAVLAHEVGHTCAHHHVKQAVWEAEKSTTIGIAASVAGNAAGIVVGSNIPPGLLLHPELTGKLAGLAGSMAATMTAVLGETIAKPVREGHGDAAEREADQLGRKFLPQAGYEKRLLRTVLERLLGVAMNFEGQPTAVGIKRITGERLVPERTHLVSSVAQLKERLAALGLD